MATPFLLKSSSFHFSPSLLRGVGEWGQVFCKHNVCSKHCFPSLRGASLHCTVCSAHNIYHNTNTTSSLRGASLHCTAHWMMFLRSGLHWSFHSPNCTVHTVHCNVHCTCFIALAPCTLYFAMYIAHRCQWTLQIPSLRPIMEQKCFIGGRTWIFIEN